MSAVTLQCARCGTVSTVAQGSIAFCESCGEMLDPRAMSVTPRAASGLSTAPMMPARPPSATATQPTFPAFGSQPPPGPGFGAPPAFPSNPGFASQPGNPAADFGPTATQPAFPSNPGFASQPGMAAQPAGFGPTAPAFPSNPGFPAAPFGAGPPPSSPALAAQNAFATQPGMAAHPGGAFATQPGMAAQPGGAFATQPGMPAHPGGAFATQPSFPAHPGAGQPAQSPFATTPELVSPAFGVLHPGSDGAGFGGPQAPFGAPPAFGDAPPPHDAAEGPAAPFGEAPPAGGAPVVEGAITQELEAAPPVEEISAAERVARLAGPKAERPVILVKLTAPGLEDAVRRAALGLPATFNRTRAEGTPAIVVRGLLASQATMLKDKLDRLGIACALVPADQLKVGLSGADLKLALAVLAQKKKAIGIAAGALAVLIVGYLVAQPILRKRERDAALRNLSASVVEEAVEPEPPPPPPGAIIPETIGFGGRDAAWWQKRIVDLRAAELTTPTEERPRLRAVIDDTERKAKRFGIPLPR